MLTYCFAGPQETEEELQNVTNQYTAGLAAYQRDGQDSNAEALVTEKRELEATIKKREALVRQCTVRCPHSSPVRITR